MEVDTNTMKSRVTVRSGQAKRPKEKGSIMEQDIDGLEYSSEEDTNKVNEELDDIYGINSKKSKSVRRIRRTLI